MKADLASQIPTYRAPRGRFEIVTVPRLRYLMVDGHGDPNTSTAYADALRTIYPMAYALKFASRRDLDRDYTVMPLEALWWADDMASFTDARDKTRWSWTLLNLVPDWVTHDHVDAARATLSRQGTAPALPALRCEPFDEGTSVQTLHVGSYDDEASVLRAMHDEFIPGQGLRMVGRHHEIYLSDPRRTSADRLRTVLRQPVARTV